LTRFICAPGLLRSTATDKHRQIIESLSIPYRLLLSGHRPCFCLLTISPCLIPGSVCLNLPPRT
ncbi:hypothetical protein ATANTOWER_021874, partial [Ataeniobius toweri]|nr:hypothetical protein [Ataeniobius toweri]